MARKENIKRESSGKDWHRYFYTFSKGDMLQMTIKRRESYYPVGQTEIGLSVTGAIHSFFLRRHTEFAL